MNKGAFKIKDDFVSTELINQTLIKLENFNWKPVWEDKQYGGDKWLTCSLIKDFNETENFDNFPIAKVIKDKLKCDIKSLMFYSMLPGGEVHEHRDMDGNVGFGGIRFHVPLVTNDDVIFKVSGERIKMGVGEFWALDTSYKHAVANFGQEQRIHVVMIVIINDWVKTLLPPKDFLHYMHMVHLFLLAIGRLIKQVFKDPRKIKGFIGVVKNSLKLILGKLKK